MTWDDVKLWQIAVCALAVGVGLGFGLVMYAPLWAIGLLR